MTKLRLQQIQDEVADFGAANLASHEASPETLHDIMKNLTRNLKRRFGTEGASAVENYYGQEAAHGTLAHYASGEAVDLTIKHEASAQKIVVDAAGAVGIKAVNDSKFEVTGAQKKLELEALGADAQIWVKATDKITAYGNAVEVESKTGLMNLKSAGNLQLDITSAIDANAASYDGDFTGAVSFVAGANSEMLITGDLHLSSSAIVNFDGAEFDIDASDKLDMDSVNNMTLTAGGSMSIAGTSDSDFNSGAKLTLSAVQDFKGEGSVLELDATSTFIGLEDGYRASSNASSWAYSGIKLAKDAGEWSAFHASFGEVSILKAITDAALGGTEDAADYVLVMEGSEIAGTKMSAVTIATASNRQVIDDAAGSADWTLGTIPCAGLTANEALRNVAIFVNGQRLISGADYSLNYLNETIDPQFTFALEAADVVMIEVG